MSGHPRVRRATGRPFHWAVVGRHRWRGRRGRRRRSASTSRHGGRWFAVLEERVVRTPLAVAAAPGHFTSRLRSPAVAARVGLWLGICFGIASSPGCSATSRRTLAPFTFPTRPSWGYRVTQGLHVSAAPQPCRCCSSSCGRSTRGCSTRPPSRRARQLAVTALERVSIAVLVAGAIFQLATGLANSAQWYPWVFSFRATHYAVAWVAIGALLVHIAVKLPLIRTRSPRDVDDTARPVAPRSSRRAARRGLLRTTWLAGGVAVLAPLARPCRCCAGCQCSGSGRETAPAASRSTRAQGRQGHPDGDQPGVPAHRDQRRDAR